MLRNIEYWSDILNVFFPICHGQWLGEGGGIYGIKGTGEFDTSDQDGYYVVSIFRNIFQSHEGGSKLLTSKVVAACRGDQKSVPTWCLTCFLRHSFVPLR